jgi:hypothetical protein
MKRWRSHCQRQVSALGIAVDESLLLPTPTAGDANASGSRRKEGSQANPGVSLTDVVIHGQELHHHVERKPNAGHLSPRFVEWLMGFPAGWTSIPDRQLSLFPSPQK